VHGLWEVIEDLRSPAVEDAADAPNTLSFSGDFKRRLPKFDQRALRLYNLVYGRADAPRFAAGDQHYYWRWRYRPDAPCAPEAVVLDCAHGKMQLALHNDFVFEPALDIAWRPLSGEARLMAWALRYEPVLLQLQRLLGTDLEPSAMAGGVEMQQLREALRLDFSVLDAQQNRVLSGTLTVPEEIDGTQLAASNEGSASRGIADCVPIRLSIDVARVELALKELRRLEIADVVRIGTASLVQDQASIALVPPGATVKFIARLQGTRAMLERVEYAGSGAAITNEGNFTMPSGPEDSAPAAQAAGDQLDIDALPVTLTFTVGECTLTVGELSRLNPGYTFDLQRKLEQSPVTVRANGRPFAKGEFVLINDFLGVRILELVS
jgi:type III secretion system YscQ/HrcQ family protein